MHVAVDEDTANQIAFIFAAFEVERVGEEVVDIYDAAILKHCEVNSSYEDNTASAGIYDKS